MSWGVVGRHVIPVDDQREHYTIVHCWCIPTIDDGVIIHHALDCREYYEPDFDPTVQQRPS